MEEKIFSVVSRHPLPAEGSQEFTEDSSEEDTDMIEFDDEEDEDAER